MAKDLSNWNPEDNDQWLSTGKSIATRNLWISIPCLLASFAIWMYWGVITVQMLNLGFPFAKSELFSLMAIAGLSGATLRIPSTFFIRIAVWAQYHFLYHRLAASACLWCRFCTTGCEYTAVAISAVSAVVGYWWW